MAAADLGADLPGAHPGSGTDPGQSDVTPAADTLAVTVLIAITLESFKGQTEANAMARVRPIVDEMDRQVGAAGDLTE